MASLAAVLLHKAAQGQPVRSSLNSHFSDLKELDFQLRRRVTSPRNFSTFSLVHDHYAQLRAPAGGAFNQATIPLKHLRQVSSHDSVYVRRSRGRSKPPTPRITLQTEGYSTTISRAMNASSPRLNSSPSSRLSAVPFTKTVTFASDTPRLRPGTSWKSATLEQDLRLTCAPTGRSVKTARRQVKRMTRKWTKSFKACAREVNQALKADVQGYVPKSLQEYKVRKAEERRLAGKTVSTAEAPIVNIRKEVIREYKSDLVAKALARGVDKDMRYMYTFGSVSSVTS